MSNFNPQIANLYWVAIWNWCGHNWNNLVGTMMEMYKCGRFTPRKATKTKNLGT